MAEFERIMLDLINEIHDVVFEDKERLEKDTEYLKKASDSIISISDKLYWMRVQHEVDVFGAERGAKLEVLKSLKAQCKSVGVEYLRLEDIDDFIKEIEQCDTYTE